MIKSRINKSNHTHIETKLHHFEPVTTKRQPNQPFQVLNQITLKFQNPVQEEIDMKRH